MSLDFLLILVFHSTIFFYILFVTTYLFINYINICVLFKQKISLQRNQVILRVLCRVFSCFLLLKSIRFVRLWKTRKHHVSLKNTHSLKHKTLFNVSKYDLYYQFWKKASQYIYSVSRIDFKVKEKEWDIYFTNMNLLLYFVLLFFDLEIQQYLTSIYRYIYIPVQTETRKSYSSWINK